MLGLLDKPYVVVVLHGGGDGSIGLLIKFAKAAQPSLHYAAVETDAVLLAHFTPVADALRFHPGNFRLFLRI